MGGFGSGNWYRRDTKRTVESCLALNVNRLARDRIFDEGKSGSLIWGNPVRPDSTISYFTGERDGHLYLVLLYTLQPSQERIVLPIRMVTTTPLFGGWRWWFTCPLMKNNHPCCRRVGKLYLRGNFFGCRHCHNLTYRSCQEAHQDARLAAQFGCDPGILKELKKRYD